LEIELILLRRNHYPLKTLPTLIWVEEFEFVTQLKLEECYAKLAIAHNNRTHAKNQIIKITEILWDGNNVYFAAEMTRNYGRISAWAGLEGKVSKNERDRQIYVHIYLGDNPSGVGFSILLCVLLFFSTLFYYHWNIIIGILFSSLCCLLLTNSFRRLMKGIIGDFKYEIAQLLSDESNLK
jgi:hypothetical protein